MDDQTRQTIEDFGDQWVRYQSNDGYYGSLELFRDICGPLIAPGELRGAEVAEIGSGAGRIVRMLFAAGVSRALAIEPSDAFDVLVKNTRDLAERIEYVRGPGEAIDEARGLDAVFSIGVLHHVADPAPIVEAAYRSLRPGGKMLVWLYGREGNESYLRVIEPLRRLTTRIPPRALSGVSHVLNLGLSLYVPLCRVLPLPLAGYINNVIGRFSRQKRHLVIYDQLNPQLARYYRRAEAKALLVDAGFENVRLHHRHGYSWTVIGEKPGAQAKPG